MIPNFIKESIISNPVSIWMEQHLRDLFVGSLRTGQLPNHVAFIMDGNRRYAKNNGIEVSKGHEAGSKSLVHIIDACNQLHIKHVSCYAFSIENFNRSPQEVDTLFEILVDKLNLFLDNEKDYNKLVQIRIIGNKSYIPRDTLIKLEEIERLTQKNNDLILNVNFSYTSRDEITHSISKIIDKSLNNEIITKKIDINEFQKNFYYPEDTPPVDLLIRTSGHTRLSDYLIWQVNDDQISTIEFINVYWPDFKILQFYYLLLKWSYNKSWKQTREEWSNISIFGNNTLNESGINLKDLPNPPPLVSILGKK
ncbi:Undecaprenyl pyrophosphate synthetase [Wickerhamomyces ciferrii]|uniref:Alkyl transferase n=1 Tax=Wickerhamomyces ciferrii (strain ATCC 14091 / BCRC 22168 / CBS 111 / JCM 3599 / NBRC 0793 / NRRL Y-1031 F-60-10) TaxID=1206466 RepID=K0KVN3_WICCF|nr:Undecaprenyl pyrophosphate synthetase [Wickerhamomyces ciferrii]CCH46007.1 Undecaprenyl pyrophosphate synthetase [Wickerhamomyces ciferrii]